VRGCERRGESAARSFFRPRRFAPALTPSTRDRYQTQNNDMIVVPLDMRACSHGGSVMMASKSAPHLQGFRVMSKVHRSKMRCRTPYCTAARMIPGCPSGGDNTMVCHLDERKSSNHQPFPRICRPSISEPNTSEPK
jgi:hypothetical protein